MDQPSKGLANLFLTLFFFKSLKYICLSTEFAKRLPVTNLSTFHMK